MSIMFCVQAKAVRVSAGSNLGQLSVLSMRVDMLATDLAITAGTASQVTLLAMTMLRACLHRSVVSARLSTLITVFVSR